MTLIDAIAKHNGVKSPTVSTDQFVTDLRFQALLRNSDEYLMQLLGIAVSNKSERGGATLAYNNIEGAAQDLPCNADGVVLVTERALRYI